MGFKVAPRRPTSVPAFAVIQKRALARKGQAFLDERLRTPARPAQLRAVGDDRYLSRMAQGIFSAGFVWKIVENKWPSFEEAFGGFDVDRTAGLDEMAIDELATDTRVIRNRPKLVAVRDNARFIKEAATEHGGFGAYLAAWSSRDAVGLFDELAERGSRLGGFTGPMFLRHAGFDTFMLTDSVSRALIDAGVVQKHPTSRRDRRATQDAFNQWQDETGLPMCQLSQLLAFSVPDQV